MGMGMVRGYNMYNIHISAAEKLGIVGKNHTSIGL